MAFLRNLLATIVGLFIFSFLSFFFFIGIVASMGAEEIPEVKENTVLHLKLYGQLKERTSDDPFQELFPNSSVQTQSLQDIVSSIRDAEWNDNVKGIYIEPLYLSAGFASLQEIRNALLDFKEAGKFIYAYAEYMSEGDYYLASVADKVFLNPEGSLEFNGLSANVTFFKGLFDKLGVEPEIFRVGEFKSAIEPLTRTSMSEENRLQFNELLASIYDHYLEGISNSRGIEVDALASISNEMKAYLPEESVESGLIDEIVYEDKVHDLMVEATGVSEFEDLNLMRPGRYAKTISNEYSRDRIAVIVADGEIVMGDTDEEVVAGDRFVREIRSARENDRVKAIVLRVNSPGGSLTASDMIWREVQLTKGNKPIVVSMGDYAASGGYYISALADTIVAQPNTITGSIGIFGIRFNLKSFLNNKIGITNETVTTGRYSDMMNVMRPLTEQEKQIIQRGVEKGYDTFIEKVSEGRNLSREAVIEIAGGRVWSGLQAHERGLVDVLGGMDDAISIAADMAEVVDYKVNFYPEKKPFIEEFMSRLNSGVRIDLFGRASDIFDQYQSELNSLARLQGIQARMPDIEVY